MPSWRRAANFVSACSLKVPYGIESDTGITAGALHR